MAKKLPPLKVYSVRLNDRDVDTLKRRAREQGLPVAMIIRAIIGDYLNDRDSDDYLRAMEERIVATINRLNRTQLQVRRVADISVAQAEYIRRLVDLAYTKRTPTDDLQDILTRQRATFMTWLPKALASTGVVRQMIRQVMDPPESVSSVQDEIQTSSAGENVND